MDQENIFAIGAQVKGNSFIGRKALLKEFSDNLFQLETRRIYSIVGLSRSGKTSFVKKLFENAPKELFCHYEDLSTKTSYFTIWFSVCQALQEYLELNFEPNDEQKKHLKVINNKLDLIVNATNEPNFDNSIEWESFQSTITRIFKLLKKLQIKIVLAFDEFDHATSLFKLGTAQYSLFRTIFADGDIDISAITISRRKLETIEGQVYQSSTLANVTDFRPFKGFNEEDLAEYYKIFEDHYDYTLSPSERSSIEYYSGNLPYILSIIGLEIVNTLKEQQSINIDLIANTRCPSIQKYYESCINELRRAKYLEKIIPFVIGPKYGVTVADQKFLESLGYLSVSFSSDHKHSKYICISKYFATYLKLALRELPIFYDIINVEKRLKELLLYRSFIIVKDFNLIGDLEAIEEQILTKAGINDKEIKKLSTFAKNNSNTNNGDTLYQVMSLRDTIQVMYFFWNSYFKDYFDGKPYDHFKDRFKKIYDARNPVAHGHEDKALSEADKNEVNSYCNEILELLSKTFPPTIEIKPEHKLARKL